MISAEKIIRLIRRYGNTVSLYRQDGVPRGVEYGAFIQPLRYKNKMYIEGTRTRIGIADTSYYLYIGPGDVGLEKLPNTTRIHMGDREFWISHIETVYLQNQPVYEWAVLRALVERE